MNLTNLQPKIYFRSAQRTKNNQAIDISDFGLQVASMNLTKNISQIAGHFQLNLIPSGNSSTNIMSPKTINRIYKLLRQNDAITIDLQGIGGVMTGLVDFTGKYGSYGKHSVNLGVTVSGRDFGGIFEDENLGFLYSGISLSQDELRKANELLESEHPLFLIADSERAPNGTFLGKSVQEAVFFILDHLTSMKTPVIFDGKKYDIIDMLATEISSWPGDVIGSDYNHNTYQGSILNFLYTLIDYDFFEIVVDTFPRITNNSLGFSNLGDVNFAFPVLRIRPKPFSDRYDRYSQADEWNNLKTWITNEDYHTIHDSEILESNFCVSKNSIYSVFYVESEREILFNTDFRNNGIYFPIVDARLLNLYGFRPINAKTAMIQEESHFERLFEKRNRFYSWNRYNEYYESGSVRILGRARIKVGDKIFFSEEHSKGGKRGIVAYCTGVQHNYNVEAIDDAKFSTTIQFERGHNEDEYKEFTDKTANNVLEINAGKGKYIYDYIFDENQQQTEIV